MDRVFMVLSLITSVALFLALFGGIEIGRFLGRRFDHSQDSGGTAAAEGVVFAILGLLIAFTFTWSASRFDERRGLIVQQVNAMGTANLRLNILVPADRTAIRKKMTEWVDLALLAKDFTNQQGDLDAALARADDLQHGIWRAALAAVERKQQPALTMFVMAPLNEWIDLTTTRAAMNKRGLPPMVLPTLVVLAIVGSVLAGYGMSRSRRRRLLHTFAFAGAMAFSIYVILDLTNPRNGLINIDSMDSALVELRKSIQHDTHD